MSVIKLLKLKIRQVTWTRQMSSFLSSILNFVYLLKYIVLFITREKGCIAK